MATESVAVLVLGENGRKLLLHKREDFRIWSLPAGRIEKGETEQQAGVREAKEETGYDVALGEKIGSYWRPQLPHGGDLIHVYLGEVTGGDASEHGWEAVAVAWFPLTQLPRRTGRPTREMVADWLSDAPKPIERTQLFPKREMALLWVLLRLRAVRNIVLGRPRDVVRE